MPQVDKIWKIEALGAPEHLHPERPRGEGVREREAADGGLELRQPGAGGARLDAHQERGRGPLGGAS